MVDAVSSVTHAHTCLCGKVTIAACACDNPGQAYIDRCCVEAVTEGRL